MSLGGLNIMKRRLAATLLATVSISAALTGCRKVEMHEQEKKDPFEQSPVFADGIASRPIIAGTVVRGQPRTDAAKYVGIDANGRAVTEFPWQMTAADLHRGKERYDIYCYICHGQTGYGDGMAVRRGFVRPQSFHSQRLKDAPPGYYYQVVTNGLGAMYSYAERVTPEDRWRIAAYIKTLQISQSQSFAALTPEEQQKVQDSTKPAPQPAAGAKSEGHH